VRLADFGLVKEDRAARSATPKFVGAFKDSLELKELMLERQDADVDDGEHTRGVGTLGYLSPEQRLGAAYDYKVDVFALGLVLAELLFPVRTNMERSQLFAALHNNNNKNNKREGPPIAEALYPDVVDLLHDMIALDPSQRPNASEVGLVLHSKTFGGVAYQRR